jgi:hypothetical protein
MELQDSLGLLLYGHRSLLINTGEQEKNHEMICRPVGLRSLIENS